MKLSKNELNVLLNARMEWHLDSAEFLRSQGFSGKKNDDFYERYEALLNELEDGTLEIEGYERSGWTKFDPDDPKTFPAKNKHIYITNIYANHDERWACKLCEYYLELVIEKLSSSVKEHGAVIHWRPLPTPPGKEEAK